MNVAQMIEALQALPAHWPVHVAMPISQRRAKAEALEFTHTGESNRCDPDLEYLFTLDVGHTNFPTQGNIAVININQHPT